MRDYKNEKKEFIYGLILISICILITAILFVSCKANRISVLEKPIPFVKVDSTNFGDTDLVMFENHSEIKPISPINTVKHISAKTVRPKLGFWLSLTVIVPIAFLIIRRVVK
jgi:hypothetical protein